MRIRDAAQALADFFVVWQGSDGLTCATHFIHFTHGFDHFEYSCSLGNPALA
jgi:hypothetical protein